MPQDEDEQRMGLAAMPGILVIITLDQGQLEEGPGNCQNTHQEILMKTETAGIAGLCLQYLLSELLPFK